MKEFDTIRELFSIGPTAYELSSLMTMTVALLYVALSMIFHSRRAQTGRAFLIIGVGWLLNVIYLASVRQLSTAGFDSSVITVWELVVVSVSSTLFMDGAIRQPWSQVQGGSKLYFLRSLGLVSVIAPVIEYCVTGRTEFSAVYCVLFHASSLAAIGAAYQQYFSSTRGRFSRVTRASLIWSMYTYGFLQMSSISFVRQSILAPWLEWDVLLFLLGGIIKSWHILGLLSYLRNLFSDYEMKRRLYHDSRARGNLFDQLAHELGTPLAELNLRLGAMEERRNSDDGTFKKEISRIANAVEQVRVLIQSFQRFRLFDPDDSNAPDSQNINLICDEAVLSLKLVYATDSTFGKVRWIREYGHAVNVLCRERELYHALRNLLKNALEAVSGAEIATIRVRTFVTEGTESNLKRVVIEVADNGRGVVPELGQRIFQDGFTTKSGSRRGHGLYIARVLIERYGGTIDADPEGSMDLGGASFRICFPLAPEKLNFTNGTLKVADG